MKPLLPFVVMLLFVGCSKPKVSDLAGNYVLDEQAKAALSNKIAMTLFESRIEIREDGTFLLQNVPDWSNAAGFATLGPPRTYEGQWRISQNGLLFENNNQIEEVSLGGRRPNYSLDFFLGDPDERIVLSYKKSQQ